MQIQQNKYNTLLLLNQFKTLKVVALFPRLYIHNNKRETQKQGSLPVISTPGQVADRVKATVGDVWQCHPELQMSTLHTPLTVSGAARC